MLSVGGIGQCQFGITPPARLQQHDKNARRTNQRALLLPKPIYGVVVVVVVVSFFSIIALAGLLITTLRTIIRFPSLT